MDSEGTVIISHTESVCPVCLTKLPAVLLNRAGSVFLQKVCPVHGEFRTPIWRGDPSYETWSRPRVLLKSSQPAVKDGNGCPFDCGICHEHRQQTCTALLEVTSRCNLRCSFCFADAGHADSDDPSLSEIRAWYESLLDNGYTCNVQLSGGEPTLRDDLPEIVSLGRSMGFTFIQLNTNGLRLANDLVYVQRLRDAGLSSVFLQFDGTEDSIYQTLRDGSLFDLKVQAIRNCEQMELGVVLVPTLVSGVNLHNVGDIVVFALGNLPTVRGVHFQPATYVGRYPERPDDLRRVTLPEVMRAIEIQTAGLIRTEHLQPPGCENALCSFHGTFVVMPDGKLRALTTGRDERCSCAAEKAETGAANTRKHVAEHWTFPTHFPSSPAQDEWPMGQWDMLLGRASTHRLSVSGMAFQDAWNLDLERLKDCCIHVVARDGRLVPFCAYNLTGSEGISLYRRRLWP